MGKMTVPSFNKYPATEEEFNNRHNYILIVNTEQLI